MIVPCPLCPVQKHTLKSLQEMAMVQSILSNVSKEIYTEKSEVIDAIFAEGGSSHCTCAVCYEDYQDGDIMRVSPPCQPRCHAL